jgi:hypothetical protein
MGYDTHPKTSPTGRAAVAALFHARDDGMFVDARGVPLSIAENPSLNRTISV